MGGRKKAKSPGGDDDHHQQNNGHSPLGVLSAATAAVRRHVQFNASPEGKANGGVSNSAPGMRKSPSMGTLNRLEREKYVLWQKPLHTICYCLMELCCIAGDFIRGLLHPARLLPLLALLAVAAAAYLVEGPHQVWAKQVERPLLWSLYWVWLGVLSSVGFGTGLHTFVLYLGPHIAHVTLAAYECGSVAFPEPPYPDDITCPTLTIITKGSISLWDIIAKVRLEALMWGVGTALGELPPYFMARAARISGEEPDDEEYKEYVAYLEGKQIKEVAVGEAKGPLARAKIWLESLMDEIIRRVGFLAILLFASVPNPLFDIAGMTCGHFLIPFWTFFGATLIGKAIIKMHLQMLCVVLAFSDYHMEHLVNKLKVVPYVGSIIQMPLKEFLRAQKLKLHRSPGEAPSPQSTSKMETAMSLLVTTMIFVFLCSLINSLAQRYHKRRCDALKEKSQ